MEHRRAARAGAGGTSEGSRRRRRARRGAGASDAVTSRKACAPPAATDEARRTRGNVPDDGNTSKRSSVNRRVVALRAQAQRLARIADELAARAIDPSADVEDIERRVHGALEKLTGRSVIAEARMLALEALETATRSGVSDRHAAAKCLLASDETLMFHVEAADPVQLEQALHGAINAWPARGARATGSVRLQKWPAAAKLMDVLGISASATTLERDWADRRGGTTRARRKTGKRSR